LHKYLHSSEPGVLETEIDIGAFDENGAREDGGGNRIY